MTVTDKNVFPDLYEASVVELEAGLDAGHFTSVDLVKVSSGVAISNIVDFLIYNLNNRPILPA